MLCRRQISSNGDAGLLTSLAATFGRTLCQDDLRAGSAKAVRCASQRGARIPQFDLRVRLTLPAHLNGLSIPVHKLPTLWGN
jgi:hypothetical protein